MWFGFGYNYFEQLGVARPSCSSENEGCVCRAVSSPVPIFTDIRPNNNHTSKVIITWSSLHLFKEHQVTCSSKSYHCCISKEEGGGALHFEDVDMCDNNSAYIITPSALSILKGDGCRKDVHEENGNGTFRAVSAGENHTIAIKGDGGCGEVIKIDSNYVYKPFSLDRVCHVTCGKEHVLILKECGEVFSYGIGSRGQLGHGQTDAEKTPRLVEALQGIKISAISCGGWHSAALSSIGDVYIWGWNESGQLGFPTKQKPVLTNNYEKHNSEKYSHQTEPKSQEKSCSKNIKLDTKLNYEELEHDKCSPNDNRIKSCNKNPSLLRTDGLKHSGVPGNSLRESSGNEDVTIQFAMLPSLLDFPEGINVSKVGCGSRHSAAVLENGDLYTWGWGKYGQLGHGNIHSTDRPTLVTKLQGKQAVNVICGAWNTVVLCKSLPL